MGCRPSRALPPAVARRVLSEASASADGPRPSDLHAALLCLFRLLYLDGYDSGIVSEHATGAESSGEVVARVHRKLERAGLQAPAPLTLESLDALMQTHRFRPPVEMLKRLAHRNAWIADVLTRLGEWKTVEPAGWVVFYLRQRVVEESKVDLLINSLRREGFIFPDIPQPDADQMRKLTAEVRGGNWGRGPFPQSGGEPAMVIVGFDPYPTAVPKALLQQHPLLDNARIQTAKKAVRKILRKGLPRNERYNGFHSTDNSVQAWRAIRSMYPHLEAALREAVRSR
jgi:hypothetical protein